MLPTSPELRKRNEGDQQGYICTDRERYHNDHKPFQVRSNWNKPRCSDALKSREHCMEIVNDGLDTPEYQGCSRGTTPWFRP